MLLLSKSDQNYESCGHLNSKEIYFCIPFQAASQIILFGTQITKGNIRANIHTAHISLKRDQGTPRRAVPNFSVFPASGKNEVSNTAKIFFVWYALSWVGM